MRLVDRLSNGTSALNGKMNCIATHKNIIDVNTVDAALADAALAEGDGVFTISSSLEEGVES
jgi:hypothetical protein